jgi:hypothetical protein
MGGYLVYADGFPDGFITLYDIADFKTNHIEAKIVGNERLRKE